MGNKVPDDVAKEIKERIYELANECNYLALGRTDSGKFMTQLVTLDDVGGCLASYMKKAEIRTYIKDAVLNRYSKDRTEEERPDSFEPIIQDILGFAVEKEVDLPNSNQLYKQSDFHPNKNYVIVSEGTLLKWETALRKALLSIGSMPISKNEGVSITVLLSLFAQYQRITASDRQHLYDSLSFCNAKPYIYGECRT